MGRHEEIISVQEREENVAAQLEELEALEAIYAEGYEVIQGSAAHTTPEIRIRVSEVPLVSLHVTLPTGYPSRNVPEVEIKAPGLAQSARRELCRGTSVDGESGDAGESRSPAQEDEVRSPSRSGRDRESEEPLEAEPYVAEIVEIVHGQAFTDRKSTFQAHLAKVSSEEQVAWVRRRLMENGKIARATHNVAAWRVWDKVRGVQLHDNDDDGESAAGSRLAHMMAITGAQNVVVVVSRWFGGIHLGPDRFKHINNAARELLVQCGATKEAGKQGGGGGGKHRGRRKRDSGGQGS
ncbi:unnamed protein product [Scytosiphon promiscuus]